MSADSALRANVRLLGDLLGQVLVEQEGEELLDGEERIRALARDARGGGSREALRQAVSQLGLEQQAAVLRAFALFFQLANIAEQHHRIRRRREYEREGRVPRESLADAFGQLREAGVDDGRPARGSRADCASSSSSRPIRRRRPAVPCSRHTAASPRSWRASTTRMRRRRERRQLEDSLAEEITLLWQTDEIRSKRPRVVDEIRQGLWFFEQSFWNAVPDLERELAERARRGADGRSGSGPGSAATSTATRTSGRTRSRMRSSVRGQLARTLYRDELRGWARRGGCRPTVIGDVPELGRRG